MSIVKKNLYSPGQNLNNLSSNVDINRVSMDRSFITVNFGGATPVVTIQIGSLIEVNGAMYAIESTTESATFSSASHFYLGFDGTSWKSFATQGSFDSTRGGYYQTGGDSNYRTLRWYINDINSFYYIDQEVESSSASNGLYLNDKLKVNGEITSNTNIAVDVTQRDISAIGPSIDTNLTWTFNVTNGRIYKSILLGEYQQSTTSDFIWINHSVISGPAVSYITFPNQPGALYTDRMFNTIPYTGASFDRAATTSFIRAVGDGLVSMSMEHAFPTAGTAYVKNRYAYIEAIGVE